MQTMKNRKGLVVQLVDFKKFFDSERLRAIMATLNSAKMNSKAYKCWFKLNKNTTINVATPAGLTQTAEVGEIVAQGSGGAALVSGADVARGLESHFSGSQDEMSYGSIRLQPLAYQDDICRLASSVNSTRAGSQKLSCLMKQKGLKCHPTKSVCIIIGSKKYRTEAKKEIEDDPVMFGDFTMKFVENEVYLGDGNIAC